MRDGGELAVVVGDSDWQRVRTLELRDDEGTLALAFLPRPRLESVADAFAERAALLAAALLLAGRADLAARADDGAERSTRLAIVPGVGVLAELGARVIDHVDVLEPVQPGEVLLRVDCG